MGFGWGSCRVGHTFFFRRQSLPCLTPIHPVIQWPCAAKTHAVPKAYADSVSEAENADEAN